MCARARSKHSSHGATGRPDAQFASTMVDFSTLIRARGCRLVAMTAAGVLLGLCAALGFGCQRGNPTEPSPVANKVAPIAEAARPSGETTMATQAPPPPASRAVEPAHVTLPKSPNTPVRRTTKPFTRKQREWMAAFRFKDFDREARATNDEFTEFRHTTTTRPKLAVTVKLDACTTRRAKRTTRVKPGTPDPNACMPMQLEPWKARSEELKQSLSPELIARPDTRFEVGIRDLLGMRAIYTYQLGYFFGQDDKGQPAGDYSDAYILHYNDGVNRIQVVASYVDDPVGGKDQLVALAPPEDLERLAVAFTSFYLHRWR